MDGVSRPRSEIPIKDVNPPRVRNRRGVRNHRPGEVRADARPNPPPRSRRHGAGASGVRVARPPASVDHGCDGRQAADRRRHGLGVRGRQRRDLQPRGHPGRALGGPLRHRLRHRVGVPAGAARRLGGAARAARDVRARDGAHRRARRGGPRPDRHQAAVLGASRGRDAVRQELRAFDVEDQPMVEAFPPGHVWTPGIGQTSRTARWSVSPTRCRSRSARRGSRRTSSGPRRTSGTSATCSRTRSAAT